MTVQSIVDTIVRKYSPDHEVVEYLGTYQSRHCFGLINKDEIITYDQPFYLLVDDAGKTEQVFMPMIADDAYYDSVFASIELRYKFFENHKLLD